jgi:hypothetical protein
MRKTTRGIDSRPGPALSTGAQRRLVEILAVGLERLFRVRTHDAADHGSAQNPEPGSHLAIPPDLWLYDGHEPPPSEDEARGE